MRLKLALALAIIAAPALADELDDANTTCLKTRAQFAGHAAHGGPSYGDTGFEQWCPAIEAKWKARTDAEQAAAHAAQASKLKALSEKLNQQPQ